MAMKNRPSEGLHRVGVASEIPGLLRDLGHDPAPVFRRAGLATDAVDNLDGYIPFRALGSMLDACVAQTGCVHFGVMLGARGGTKSLGLVGEIMRNSTTFGDAIEGICLHQPRYTKGAVTYLMTDADTASWSYGVYEPDTPAIEQICDAAMSLGVQVMRELVGREPEQVLTSRARPEPGALNAFRDAFGIAPMFDADRHAVLFPKAWLRLPVIGADAKRLAAAEQFGDSFWSQVEHSFAEKVARHLQAKLLEGDLSAEAVAKYFSMTLRTFNRRLEADGATFRDLVKDARFVAARQLLAVTKMSITDISLALGYTENGNFSRAFSAAAGVTPSIWRSQLSGHRLEK